MPARRRRRLSTLQKLGLFVIVGALLGTILIESIGPHAQDPEAFAAWIERLADHAWTPWALCAAAAFCGIVIFPAMPFIVVLGLLYGPLEGAGYVAIGSSLGMLMGYGVGRLIGGPDTSHIRSPRLRRVVELAGRRGGLAAMLIRFVPGLPFAMQNAFMGSLGIPLPRFLAGSWVGVALSQGSMLVVGAMSGVLLPRAVQAVHAADSLRAIGVAVGIAMVVWTPVRARMRAAAPIDDVSETTQP